MIRLKDKMPIAVSTTRACYPHPEDAGKVIKIVRQKDISSKNNANWQEWQHYNYLLKHHGKLDFINECFGFIETDLGQGLIWQCVRDYNGEIASNMKDIVRSPEKYDLIKIEKVLNNYCDLLIKKNIQLFDLNPLNVMIRICSEGTYQAVAVDIKGRYANYEFIPISTYIPFFSRRKLRRRCNQLTKWYLNSS